jgi:hypothetical protein
MSFVKSTTTEAHSILKALPSDIDALSAWVATNLSVDAPTLRKKLSKSGVDTKINKELRNLMDDLRHQLVNHVDHMFVLERWIMSNVPRIETGNNFGVSLTRGHLRDDCHTTLSLSLSCCSRYAISHIHQMLAFKLMFCVHYPMFL